MYDGEIVEVLIEIKKALKWITYWLFLIWLLMLGR